MGKVALSTTDSEIFGVCEAVREAIWLRDLRQDLGFNQADPTALYVDSATSICLSENPCKHDRSKHIKRFCSFVREQVSNKVIKLIYIDTKKNVADAHTKAVSVATFKEFSSMMLNEPRGTSSP